MSHKHPRLIAKTLVNELHLHGNDTKGVKWSVLAKDFYLNSPKIAAPENVMTDYDTVMRVIGSTMDLLATIDPDFNWVKFQKILHVKNNKVFPFDLILMLEDILLNNPNQTAFHKNILIGYFSEKGRQHLAKLGA